MKRLAKFYNVFTEDYSTQVLAYNVNDALRVARLLCDSPIISINNDSNKMVWHRNSNFKVDADK